MSFRGRNGGVPLHIRFSIGGIDKGATKYRGFMSDQLTVFSRGAFVTVYKG